QYVWWRADIPVHKRSFSRRLTCRGQFGNELPNHVSFPRAVNEKLSIRNVRGAWQFRWDFSLGGVTYLSSWGNIWFQRPLRWRVASARKASSPLRLQNWPVSLKRRWYWEQVDSIAPEPTGWPRAFPLL